MISVCTNDNSSFRGHLHQNGRLEPRRGANYSVERQSDDRRVAGRVAEISQQINSPIVIADFVGPVYVSSLLLAIVASCAN